MLHLRNSSEYSRRRMCDDCDEMGNLKNKRLSTKPALRSLHLRVASTMPNAVAYAVRGTTKPKIVGSLANPNAASAKGSVTRPKTATQGRRRNSNVSGRLMPIGVVARRKGSVTKGREKRRTRGRKWMTMMTNISSSPPK